MHSSTQPVEWIKLSACPSGYTCDASQQFAWYDLLKQDIIVATDESKSVTWRRMVESQCEPIQAARQNLLPGRYCESNYECLSFNCTDNKCKGSLSGSSCSEHQQCEAGLGCIPKTSFPFMTTCD